MTTILIVDDHQHNRERLTRVLDAAGYQLLEAGDGAEALALVRARRPDLVIADLIMPVMDGFALVRALRADPALAQTRVIFYSATYVEREAQTLAQASGVEQILSKPATPVEILGAVARALAPRQGATPGAPLDEQFDREHIRLLTDKLATNVDQLTAVNGRLSVLLDLSRRLALEHRPAELLRTCCDAARSLIGADFAAIELVDDVGTPALWSRADGVSTEAAAFLDMPGRRGLLARLRDARTPLRVHEVGSDLAEQPLGLQSFLGVPIASATQRYGALYLLNKHGAVSFSQDDEHIALMLAAQTAVTYENVQRYEALSRHAIALEQEMAERTRAEAEQARAEERLRLYARRLETLHAIDQAIMTVQSPETIVEVVLRYLRQLIQCRRASVAIFDHALGIAELWRVETDVPTKLAAGISMPLDQMWNYPLLRQGLPTVMPDLARLESRNVRHQQMLDEGIRSYISVPIQERSDLIGALNVSFEQPDAMLEDVESIRALADQLAVAIQHLRLFEQVRVGRERLQVLSQQLVRAQEDERRRLARELHDEIGQSLTAAQLNLQGLVILDDQADLPARLEDSLGLIDRVLQQVRALSLDLRPSMLDDLGLAPALRWYVKRQAERAGFEAQLNAGDERQRYPSELETTCFRIAQEALNNIVRYAQAAHVVVDLWEEGEVLHMTVRDDGRGFDVAAGLGRAARGQSLGLVSMQERASLVGGKLEIDSAPGRGTTIRVQIPLEAGTDPEHRLERRRAVR